MTRLHLFLLAFLSMFVVAAGFWLLTPRGRGVLVDAQGRRYEVLPSRPPRRLAAEVLQRYRRWRDPGPDGSSPRDRLKGAYALLIGTTVAAAVAAAVARKATRGPEAK